MAAVANAVLTLVIFAVFAVWIAALIKWDGTIPCEPEDCKDCVFYSAECEARAKAKHQNKDQHGQNSERKSS